MLIGATSPRLTTSGKSRLVTRPAGVCAGRHIHPGIESGYVLKGDVVLKIEGKPEQTFKAGQWFPNPANTPHDVCSVGGFKTISTYVVERGKPLALPAP